MEHCHGEVELLTWARQGQRQAGDLVEHHVSVLLVRDEPRAVRRREHIDDETQAGVRRPDESVGRAWPRVAARLEPGDQRWIAGRHRRDTHVGVLRDPGDRLRYVGKSDVQADHLPADKSILDAYIVGNIRKVAHCQEAGLLGLR